MSGSREEGICMRAAVSTACLYPKPTEDALYDLCLSGVQTVEIFLNAPSETKQVFVSDLAAMLKRFGVKCAAVHPWTAPHEGFMLCSNYSRRARDFIEESKSVFTAMQMLGAEYFILHGAQTGFFKPELCYERFALLAEAAKPYGVTVTQENVFKYESQSLKYLREFVRQLGDTAKITFDTKQAVRAGMDIGEAVRVLGSHIVHVHLSDHGDLGDCLRIGKGRFRIPEFLGSLHEQGFDGTVVLELYRTGFGGVQELAEDWQRMDRMIRKIQ